MGLLDLFDLSGWIDPSDLDDRRDHIDSVSELVTYAPCQRAETGGPWHDARVGHSPPVPLALPAFERRVAGHRPTPRIVVVSERSSDLVQVLVHLFEAGGIQVGKTHVVDRTLCPTFGTRPVVRHQQDDRVVEVAYVLEKIDDALYLRVGVRQKSGKAFHEPTGDLALDVA